MKIIICDKVLRIIKAKKKLEKELNLKITVENKKVSLDGKPEEEYLGEKVIQALDFGFPFRNALEIVEENKMFEIMNIKDYTKRKDFKSIRARIIGKGGKTLKVLGDLTHCSFEIKDNQIGIIGSPEEILNGEKGMESLIRGAKQSNVYSYLEKHQIKPIEDLGLKNVKDNL
jgi:KH domain-containing protein